MTKMAYFLTTIGIMVYTNQISNESGKTESMKANVKNVLNDKSVVHTKFSEYWSNFVLSKAYHTLGGATESAKQAWTQSLYISQCLGVLVGVSIFIRGCHNAHVPCQSAISTSNQNPIPSVHLRVLWSPLATPKPSHCITQQLSQNS